MSTLNKNRFARTSPTQQFETFSRQAMSDPPHPPPSSPVNTHEIEIMNKENMKKLYKDKALSPDIDTDINIKNTDDETYTPKCIETWEELPAKTNILRGIYAYGFEKPSPIQKQAILTMFDKKDIIAQAQSGTGKTGCFAIGALQAVDESVAATQVIILSPTRELSMQTKAVIDAIGSQCKDIKTKLLVGGTSSEKDSQSLQTQKPHIIIGCPGRVYDMLRRRKVQSSALSLIILDEADEMLSSGFKDQVYDIFQYLPQEIQVALFSATIPIELNSLTEAFMRDPVKILVKTEQLTLEGIRQYYIALENDNEKYDALKDLYGDIALSQCIIYCNSVNRVQDLYDAMAADDFPVGQIHSKMNKFEREKNYRDFSIGTTRVLISSNVTARGIDVQQVSTVINFDIPKCVHTYLHRIGRSGRWGRKGMGINFVTKRDLRNMKEVEQYYHTSITELPATFANELR
jgi:translation initiation factor 4A